MYIFNSFINLIKCLCILQYMIQKNKNWIHNIIHFLTTLINNNISCDFQLAFIGFNSMSNLIVIQSIFSLYLCGFNCKG